MPTEVLEVVQLNPYAVVARYPGLAEPVLPEEHLEAVRLAREVVRWVEEILVQETGTEPPVSS